MFLWNFHFWVSLIPKFPWPTARSTRWTLVDPGGIRGAPGSCCAASPCSAETAGGDLSGCGRRRPRRCSCYYSVSPSPSPSPAMSCFFFFFFLCANGLLNCFNASLECRRLCRSAVAFFASGVSVAQNKRTCRSQVAFDSWLICFE